MTFAIGKEFGLSDLGGIVFIRRSKEVSFAEATTLEEVHKNKELFEVALRDVQELFSVLSYSGYVAIASVPTLDSVSHYLKGDVLEFWNLMNQNKEFNEKLVGFFELADKFE